MLRQRRLELQAKGKRYCEQPQAECDILGPFRFHSDKESGRQCRHHKRGRRERKKTKLEHQLDIMLSKSERQAQDSALNARLPLREIDRHSIVRL